MAKLILDYYIGKDLYSDGAVEKHILEAVQNKWDLLDLSEYVKPEEYFVFLYHLSSMQENILNWYPFKQGCRILEVGSGCGAITGLLCRKAGWVTSVELSRQRAQINYERNKNIENLEIVVGNLNDLSPENSYDYVILNGVLEYACSFTEGEKPFHSFLKIVKRYLKPHGVLLTAIENRLGAKYFAGAVEDHTDKCFWGIKQYPQDNSVRTFSKYELTNLLKESGFAYQRFYYPFPDYKFPMEIFTDDNINDGLYGRKRVVFEKYHGRIFDEQLLEKSFAHEKIMDRFANSYLVEASQAKLKGGYVSYAKLNAVRRKQFAIGINIQKDKFGKRRVIKYALTDEAVGHIQVINKNEYISKFNLQGNYKSGKIEYCFLKGETLNARIVKLIQNDKIEKAFEIIGDVIDKFCGKGVAKKDIYTKQFVALFGTRKLEEELECISNVNIDLTFDNIFNTKAGYKVIDCEWYVDTAIPKKFVLWRILNEWFYQNLEVRNRITYEKILSFFEINYEEDKCFREWANHFADNYVSDIRMQNYMKQNYEVEVTKLLSADNVADIITTSIYIDSGRGFSEEEKVWEQIAISQSGEFSVVFDLSAWEKIKAIRWDPLEGEVVKCENIVGTIDDVEVDLRSCNDENNINGLFMTTDPQYICTQINAGSKKMHIKGKMLRLKQAEHLISVYRNRIANRIGG